MLPLFRRNNFVERVVVNGIRLPVKLRGGGIHSLMNAKLIEVGSISRIQLSAAVILWIGVVIRDSLAALVVVGAQHSPGYVLWTTIVAAVAIRQAFVLASRMIGKTRLRITSMSLRTI